MKCWNLNGRGRLNGEEEWHRVNDSVLYRGVKKPNHGFFYIVPENPVEKDKIKMGSFGQTEFIDVYKLVEITGKLDKETANDKAIKNVSSLNIVEIEVFEEVK